MHATSVAPSVARRVLFRLAMITTIPGLVLLIASVVVDSIANISRPLAVVGIVGAVLIYIGIALWVAYGVVRLVGRVRAESA